MQGGEAGEAQVSKGALKMREWKMREHIAGVENAGVENSGVDRRGRNAGM